MIGDKVIGALDLQSTQAGAFPDRDLPTYQTLADHIAIAIDNARLFDEAQRRLEENRYLVEQSRSALREVERMNMRLTGRAWSEFLQGQQGAVGLLLDFEQNQVLPAADWTDGLKQALDHNRAVQTWGNGRQVLAVPLRVRGQPVGAMEFELDENGRISPEDMALVEEVSERFGLAVETARLYQESQRSAQREALINEISARLQASNNVESTLNEAARSLQQTLKAKRVAIRLGQPAANGSHADNQGGDA
jgi:GAF domain-containing protein